MKENIVRRKFKKKKKCKKGDIKRTNCFQLPPKNTCTFQLCMDFSVLRNCMCFSNLISRKTPQYNVINCVNNL